MTRPAQSALTPLPAPRKQADIGAALAAISAALAGSGAPVLPLPRHALDGFIAAARLDEPPDDLDLDAAESVAAAVATSGSTGVPKLALLTGAALHASGAATAERIGGHGQWLLALPTEHVAGFQVLVRSVLAGTVPQLIEPGTSFGPAAFVAATAQMDGGRRYVSLVPTQLRRLLDGSPAALDALRSYDAVLVGGAALADSLYAAARELGVRVITTYGMTETCGGCVYDGRPLAGVRVRADADRPIRLGGPTVSVGYRARPDLTATSLVRDDDGTRWHLTADLGQLDETGRLTVLGRSDDVIVTGGEKVSPAAVEAVLIGDPRVREVAVIGRPDREWGACVVAVVVATDQSDPPTLDGLRGAARSSLPSHALPRELRVVEQIPLLASGKRDRAALRAIASDAADPRAT